MFEVMKQRRAAQRVKPGNGRALKPFRWWQPFDRALFTLSLDGAAGGPVVYTVDVRSGQRLLSEDGKGKADLYLDGVHHAESKLPAAFPVEGGTIEVAATDFGLRRCHYVTAEGAERQLVPDRASAEGRRARLGREHPTLSRWIGFFSVFLLVTSLVLLVPQIIEVITLVPPVAERFGTFVSPVQLPIWASSALALAAVLASTERALRLRHHWLLDSAA
jgi:hypothetical protein